MDSRVIAADLAGGNRELLQTLAIEASTVLENARLLEEERTKQQMEEELRLARTIQQSLLPGSLPSEGWLRASGSSVASPRGGRRLFRCNAGEPALLVGGRGGCIRQGSRFGAAGIAAAGSADRGYRAPRCPGAADRAAEPVSTRPHGRRKVRDGFLCPPGPHRPVQLCECRALSALDRPRRRRSSRAGSYGDAGRTDR